MKWNSRFRCTLTCFGFIALFSIFSFRLVYLQMIKHDEYAELAAEKHVKKQPIFASRGMILDANNEVLAHNVPMRTIAAEPRYLTNVEATTLLISQELKIPAAEVAEKLRSDRNYVVVQREVEEGPALALKAKLEAKKLRGVRFDPDSRRIYPNNSMLCHVIGFTDFEHHGI